MKHRNASKGNRDQSCARGKLMRGHALVTAASALVAFGATRAIAQTLYWDANSSLGGSGTWDVNTTQNWSSVNTAQAPDSKWTPNDGTESAAFNGGATYTVTIDPA